MKKLGVIVFLIVLFSIQLLRAQTYSFDKVYVRNSDLSWQLMEDNKFRLLTISEKEIKIEIDGVYVMTLIKEPEQLMRTKIFNCIDQRGEPILMTITDNMVLRVYIDDRRYKILLNKI